MTLSIPCGHDGTETECSLCEVFRTDDVCNRKWGGPGVGPPRRRPRPSPLPCVHLGAPTGERADCEVCGGRKQLPVHACAVHGECSPEGVLVRKGVRTTDCGSCRYGKLGYEPDTFALVAPLGTADQPARWEGRARTRPWNYRSTAVVPHLDTPELLAACVDLLRLQTEPPYIVVVDTGSPPAVCERLEKTRAEDLEIHFVRGNGYTNSSEPVAVALDLGMARVNTDLVFLTHADCFARRRDALAWLGAQCSADCPVVGWEMSERSWITDKWRGMVSHTFTMLHAETMRRAGATWHMQRGRDLLGMGKDYRANGWPDTETAFNMSLREHGITPKILGPEINYRRQQTEWWDHARSTPGLKAYSPGSELQRAAERYAAEALADALGRAAAWRSSYRPDPTRLPRRRAESAAD